MACVGNKLMDLIFRQHLRLVSNLGFFRLYIPLRHDDARHVQCLFNARFTHATYPTHLELNLSLFLGKRGRRQRQGHQN